MTNIFILNLLFIVIFALLGMQIFGGIFNREAGFSEVDCPGGICPDPSLEPLPASTLTTSSCHPDRLHAHHWRMGRRGPWHGRRRAGLVALLRRRGHLRPLRRDEPARCDRPRGICRSRTGARAHIGACAGVAHRLTARRLAARRLAARRRASSTLHRARRRRGSAQRRWSGARPPSMAAAPARRALLSPAVGPPAGREPSPSGAHPGAPSSSGALGAPSAARQKMRMKSAHADQQGKGKRGAAVSGGLSATRPSDEGFDDLRDYVQYSLCCCALTIHCAAAVSSSRRIPFRGVIIAAIVVSLSSCTRLPRIHRDDPDGRSVANPGLSSILSFSDVWIWPWLFGAELLIKAIAFGFAWGPKSYLASPWNRLDAGIVLVSFITLLSICTVVSRLTNLRVLRVLRPLRLVSRNPGMRLIILLFKALRRRQRLWRRARAADRLRHPRHAALRRRHGQCTNPAFTTRGRADARRQLPSTGRRPAAPLPAPQGPRGPPCCRLWRHLPVIVVQTLRGSMAYGRLADLVWPCGGRQRRPVEPTAGRQQRGKQQRRERRRRKRWPPRSRDSDDEAIASAAASRLIGSSRAVAAAPGGRRATQSSG